MPYNLYIIKKSNEYIYDKNEISRIIQFTLSDINDYIENNKYIKFGNIDEFNKIYEKNWNNISKRKLKKLQKCIFRLNQKYTLTKVNKFFHFLSQTFQIKRISIKISEQEEKIRQLRIAYKRAKYQYYKTLRDYKKEKSFFYIMTKNEISN